MPGLSTWNSIAIVIGYCTLAALALVILGFIGASTTIWVYGVLNNYRLRKLHKALRKLKDKMQ